MQVIADLQLHSRFSRAVSPQMTIPNIAQWAKIKGIGLIATGDWMHPIWFREIERDLEEIGNGLLKLRKVMLDDGSSKIDIDGRRLKMDKNNLTSTIQPQNQASNFQSPQSPLFLLATEISSIYSQNGKVRRVHTLVWVPTLESARKINAELTKRGCNLMSDGRPIVGLSCIHIAELVLTIEPKALVIPAHAWTPWFSVYGSMGGFDSIDEAFGPWAKYIYAVETGLSSNPSMNWRIGELDTRTILSFSDAHSGPKLGREATVFAIPDGKLSYDTVYQAIRGDQGKHEVGSMKQGEKNTKTLDSEFMIRDSKIAYTMEFYPEEGKYHYSGHRNCHIRWSPAETHEKGSTCPVCGKSLTQGVMQRVEELATRSEKDLELTTVSLPDSTIRMTGSNAFPKRPPFVMLVPLQEIIAEAIHSPVTSPKVQVLYRKLTDKFSGEFNVLLRSKTTDIASMAGERVAMAIEKVRIGDIVIDPGFDGVFGIVKIWKEGEEQLLETKAREQLRIF